MGRSKTTTSLRGWGNSSIFLWCKYHKWYCSKLAKDIDLERLGVWLMGWWSQALGPNLFLNGLWHMGPRDHPFRTEWSNHVEQNPLASPGRHYMAGLLGCNQPSWNLLWVAYSCKAGSVLGHFENLEHVEETHRNACVRSNRSRLEHGPSICMEHWSLPCPGPRTSLGLRHMFGSWISSWNSGSRWVRRSLLMMIILEHDQMILSENDHVSGLMLPDIFCL